MRGLLLTLCLLLGPAAAAGQARGQGPTGRLTPELQEMLRPVFEQARRDSVPVQVLEAKALEGLAKRRPAGQIAMVVRGLAVELADARRLLREAAPEARLSAGEVLAAAEAVRRGLPSDQVGALRAAVAPDVQLEIPFAVLGALVERDVPAADALDVIANMMAQNVEQARMVEIPARVDVALRVGAAPAAALNSALQGLGIRVPPVAADRPGARPETPRRRGRGGP